MTDAAERLGQLHVEHARSLMRFLISLVNGDKQAAEDLFQETMLRAWRHIGSVPTDSERARRWLFVVARRVTIDAVRMRQARPNEVSLAEASEVYAPDDAIGMALAAHAVCHAYVQLTENQQTLLAELHFRGNSIDEVARRLGIAVGTVKSRAHYALRTIHVTLAAEV
ncbi:sigma-70 family RNA polymerase sigma factor [Actinoplanes sp. NPDC000266]